jgi:hypothetical protein
MVNRYREHIESNGSARSLTSQRESWTVPILHPADRRNEGGLIPYHYLQD